MTLIVLKTTYGYGNSANMDEEGVLSWRKFTDKFARGFNNIFETSPMGFLKE